MTERAGDSGRESASPAAANKRSGTAYAPIAVTVYPSFEVLPERFAAFLDASSGHNFFQSVAWYRAVLGASGPRTDQPRIYAAECRGRPAAVLVARVRQAAGKLKSHMLLGPSHGLYAMAYTPRLDPETGAAGLRAIAAEIARRASPPLDMLRFDSLDPTPPEFAAFTAAWRAAGMLVQRFRQLDRFYADVEGLTLETYLARFPVPLQASFARLQRRWAHSGRGRFEMVTGGSELKSALIDYALVDLQSRADAEPYPLCVAEVAQAAAHAGALRLGTYRVDDTPAAAQIWIVSGGTATLWRSHHTRKFAPLAVGLALTQEMLRHILAVDRVREIDFGIDNASRCRPFIEGHERVGLLAFNPRTPRGWLGAARHIGGHAALSTARILRQRLRRVRQSLRSGR
ncbi:MAG TPA: GNAT family N-acetyltransferase [Stellaceae bacterium]|nr:GNAT family N-acetyltransferase [Stellaceae bacterium]